jgi:heme exporter protein A
MGHEAGLKPQLTLQENLQLQARTWGASPSASQIDAVMTKWGLKGKGHVPARFLSAGQKRRATLARFALLPRPLWLMDEPTTHLDKAGKDALLEALYEHQQRDGSLIFASHEHLDVKNTLHVQLAPQQNPPKGLEQHP